MKSGIYKILNLINGKFYIGSAVNFRLRWNTHRNNLNKNVRSNRYLQAAWNKNGAKNFEFLIIEYCEIDKLLEREQYWIKQTKCYDREIGYNFREIPNSNLGLKMPQTKEQITYRMGKLKGIKHTDEARRNNSKAQKGKKLSDYYKEKLRIAGIGRVFSEESKKKISAAHRANSSWPHEKGYKCNCRECLDRKNNIRKSNHQSKILPSFIMVDANVSI